MPGISMLYFNSLSQLETKIDRNDFDLSRKQEKEMYDNVDNILLLIKVLNQFHKNEYQRRVERRMIDIYTNNQTLYNELSTKFLNVVYHRFEPAADRPLFDNGKISCSKLPHDRFKYKVYLKPHKITLDDKLNYINWLQKQKDKVSITESVRNWFIRTDWNWDRRYIWVDNEKTLLLLKLRNPDVCGKVVEYVITDK